MWPHVYRHVSPSGNRRGESVEITWRVTVADGKGIRIDFENFEVEWTVSEVQDCTSYLVVSEWIKTICYSYDVYLLSLFN